MDKMVNSNIIRVECLVRSEFTVPGWTEFTVTLVPVKKGDGPSLREAVFPEFRLVTGKVIGPCVSLYILPSSTQCVHYPGTS